MPCNVRDRLKFCKKSWEDLIVMVYEMAQTQTEVYPSNCLIHAFSGDGKNLSVASSCSNIRGPTLTITMHDHIR